MLPEFHALLANVGHDAGFEHLLLVLVAVIAATKALGALAQWIGQPAVLGELVAGVLLGASVLGIFDPNDPVLHAMAELGVLILLFQIGLHTDLKSLTKVGPTALVAGLVGVILPFAGALAVTSAMGIAPLPSVVIGAALTATSIGISARVLSDLGQLKTPEGQVVIGAAVFDDVVGLIILSIVASMVAGADLTLGGVGLTAGVAIGFIVVALALGTLTIPPLFRLVERVRVSGTLSTVALGFALLLALMATHAGSAMIIGAFAAGLILHPTPQRHEIEESATQLGFFFVPMFFASVGASVDLSALVTREALLVGSLLIVVGVAGKVLAGFAPWWFKGNKLLVGVALVPRGEVGLIFAKLGLASGVLSGPRFGALMLMVVVTTFLTPPMLNLIASRRAPDDEMAPDHVGIDDLVVGSSSRKSRKLKKLHE
ncbi:MAG: cation:proton antiporter [Gemmatimonadaceae bacterium]|nr:cation:proton antiporter [Gemmatimonadaceae bacterium]